MFNTGIDIESLSLASCYLRMKPVGTDNVLATGTGFIYKYENFHYLITNGHNITRVNPETNTRISNSIAYPIKISTKLRTISNIGDKIIIGTCPYEINLYNDLEFKIPIWYVHPIHEYLVDVIAIPLFSIPNEAKLYPINAFNFNDIDIFANPSDDVFIIGYPLNITGGKELPIWKKGTIANEPSIDLDNLPKFLIDTATREGMSGSPVIFQRNGIHRFNKEHFIGNEVIGTIRSFIGIYSGRIGAEDNFKAQLGIVWKKTVIDEILNSKKSGNLNFQNI